MRIGLLLGLGLAACGGNGSAGFRPVDDGMGGIGVAGAVGNAKGGSSNAAASDTAQGGTSSGSAGESAVGAGTGGQAQGGGGASTTAGESAGGSDPGTAGSPDVGGAGGVPAAPDDTGCVEPPSDGNPGGAEPLPGLDCSGCSNGAELGYSVPDWCDAARLCQVVIDPTELDGDDVFILLPAASEQGGSCGAQPCRNGDGDLEPLIGYKLQLIVKGTAKGLRIETDEHRAVLQTETKPYSACEPAPQCGYYAGSNLRVMVADGAPRGWVRISVGGGLPCD